MLLQGILGLMTGLGIATVAAVGFLIYMDRQSQQTHTRSNYSKAAPRYTTYIAPDADTACSICLEMPNESNRTLLPCGHLFHQTCIRRWQESKKIVPELSRATVTLFGSPIHVRRS